MFVSRQMLFWIVQPRLMAATAFVDADVSAAPRIHHFADKLGLSVAALAPPILARFFAENPGCAKIIHVMRLL
jgi:hypothetical protein